MFNPSPSFISAQYLYLYLEVPLCPFNLIHQNGNNVNPTQVHAEGSLEPHSKKSKTLFSFIPDPETETTPFQSHSNTDDYLAAPCVFMDINPARY